MSCLQVRACNRSAPHLALLRDGLLLLGAAARRGGNATADGVFSAADAGVSMAGVLAAVTLQFREHEVQLATYLLLQRLQTGDR